MSKITHVNMRLADAVAIEMFGKPQERVGTDTPSDVMADIRRETLTEEPPGKVVVLCSYKEVQERFRQVLMKDRFDPARIEFLHPTPIEKEIYVPDQPAHTLVFGNALEPGEEGYEEETIDVPAKPAHLKKVTHERRPHLGNLRNMHAVKKHVQDASLLVIADPCEENGDLDCLPQLRKECPGLDVVVYHSYCEKWGVEYEGDADDALFETKSVLEKDSDLPWVIERIAHEDEVTWFLALPKQMKTWVMLCVVKALLSGWPLFGDERFKVPHTAKRVIYLIPETGRKPFFKRLKTLDLVEFIQDPISNSEGRLFIRTLSAGGKINLTNSKLLEMVKGADVFLDTAIRFLDGGDENKSSDVAVLSENIFNLIAAGARSVWCAHHAPKGFADASTMTLENMARGSGEYGAALTNAYGLRQTEEKTSTLRFHAIVGRDLDELIPDMILQGRPWLNNIGNFKVIDADAEPFSGVDKKPGPKEDPEKQQKIDFAKTIDGSGQEKTDAVNAKFSSKHGRRTIERWLQEAEPFDCTKEKHSESA